MSRLHLAVVRARHRDTDGVREAVQPLLDLPTEQRTTDIVRSTLLLRKQIRATPSKANHRLDIALETFAAGGACAAQGRE